MRRREILTAPVFAAVAGTAVASPSSSGMHASLGPALHPTMQPKDDLAMVMMTNVGGNKADAALKALAADPYKHATFAP